MSVVAAIGWGAFASASLYIGQALGRSFRVVGLVMGFGAGTLLSAVAQPAVRYSARSGFSQRSIVHTGRIPTDS
ncbi:MAG TPA: hypothetical protein VK631_29620 [Solirubrobacteraceae bacterium]|nr:hypothetical protein [Solirubrobacteraceae bacterium]